MSGVLKILFVSLYVLSSVNAEAFKKRDKTSDSVPVEIKWDNTLVLPALDGKANIGVAGVFSGFVGDRLMIAGGANFPDAAPWDGGHKTWWKDVYLLDVTTSQWTFVKDALPRALAYGISIQLPEGVLCIGGCDAGHCYQDVFLMGWKNGKLSISSEWPSLPVPLANATGALLGHRIFVAGGQESMEKQEASSHFYMLDLSDLKRGWQELPAWPGSSRGYAVSAVQNDGMDMCFYLFSGRDYRADGYMNVLTDGYVYNPRLNNWKKLDGRFPVMAGTALRIEGEYICLLGGVPGLIPGSEQHPGFDNTVRLFHTPTGMVDSIPVPFSVAVTTNVARKGQVFYITSGEIKPGIRTSSVLKGEYSIFSNRKNKKNK